MNRSNRLDDLRAQYPLPSGWSELQVVDDAIVAAGLAFHRAGVCTTCGDGEEVTGSAAALGDGDASARAYFELLERVAVKEAIAAGPGGCDLRRMTGEVFRHGDRAEVFPANPEPNRWRYARSNGVALGESWRSASQRAYWELAERDRILRSWLGEVIAVSEPAIVRGNPLARIEGYEWRGYLFPAKHSAFASDVVVAGVFGFPIFQGRPLVKGFGAGPSVDAAGGSALREAAQQVAFLWDEPVPKSQPAAGPTAMHHLERYQFAENHRALREWLAGEHAAHVDARRARAPESLASTEVALFDATPSWLTGLMVVRAVSDGALPLVFGEWDHALHLPEGRRIHPIA